jgi:23S rRNA (pseudouridine1915-N3)-methyltransferase
VKICILQVGKTKEKAYEQIEAEFLKRLQSFADVTTLTIKTSDYHQENEELQKKIPKDHVVVALDRQGIALTSEAFAARLSKIRDFEGGKVVFLIGGPKGLSPQTKQAAKYTISFSQMTFTHQMVRLFLLEQLYRAFTILTGKTYHY